MSTICLAHNATTALDLAVAGSLVAKQIGSRPQPSRGRPPMEL